jgi:hypothetical protein
MNAIEIGRVSSISETDRTVRVIFAKRDSVVSNDFVVLDHDDDWMPKVGDSVCCLCVGTNGFVIGKY